MLDCIESNYNDYQSCKESLKFLESPAGINDKIFIKMKKVLLINIKLNKMEQNQQPVVIYNGIRGESFKNLLVTILKRGKVNDSIIDKILDEEGLKLCEIAFTHPSVDNDINYEYLEFLGDGVINTAIVWYISKRFPQLKGSKGVKILARLKINLISKKSFSKCAQNLNLWDYISCSETIRNTCKKKVMEDVFEALFGAITYLMDTKIFQSSGYAVVYAIVSNLFDEMNISLKYEDLVNTHKKYYHPTNTKFISYGDLDFRDNLDYLESSILQHSEKGQRVFVDKSKRLETPREIIDFYQPEMGIGDSNVAKMAISFLCGCNNDDPYETFKLYYFII